MLTEFQKFKADIYALQFCLDFVTLPEIIREVTLQFRVVAMQLKVSVLNVRDGILMLHVHCCLSLLVLPFLSLSALNSFSLIGLIKEM